MCAQYARKAQTSCFPIIQLTQKFILNYATRKKVRNLNFSLSQEVNDKTELVDDKTELVDDKTELVNDKTELVCVLRFKVVCCK